MFVLREYYSDNAFFSRLETLGIPSQKNYGNLIQYTSAQSNWHRSLSVIHETVVNHDNSLCRVFQKKLWANREEDSLPSESSTPGSETGQKMMSGAIFGHLVITDDSWLDVVQKFQQLLLTDSATLCGFSRAMERSQSPIQPSGCSYP